MFCSAEGTLILYALLLLWSYIIPPEVQVKYVDNRTDQNNLKK